jgi:hypothetical protein
VPVDGSTTPPLPRVMRQGTSRCYGIYDSWRFVRRTTGNLLAAYWLNSFFQYSDSPLISSTGGEDSGNTVNTGKTPNPLYIYPPLYFYLFFFLKMLDVLPVLPVFTANLLKIKAINMLTCQYVASIVSNRIPASRPRA